MMVHNNLKETKEEIDPQLLEDDIDIEVDDNWLDKFMDGGDDVEEEIVDVEPAVNEPTFPEFEPQPDETTNNNGMQVVSLEDVLSIIQQVTGNTSGMSSNSQPIMTADNGAGKTSNSLQGGEEALKKVYFQNDGNETLDSDFDALYDSINNFETHVNSDSSYVDVVGAKAMQSNVEQPGLKSVDRDFDNSSSNTGSSIADGEDEIPDVDLGFDSKTSGNMPKQVQKPGFYNDIEDGEIGPERLVQDLPCSSDWDEEDDYDHDEDTGFLLDIDEDEDKINEDEELTEAPWGESNGEDWRHPDLDRISGVNDNSFDEDEFEVGIPEDEFEPAYEEEPIGTGVTMNKSVNLKGQQVQIVLTGVMITMPELDYIGESVKIAGNKLKKIEGKNNLLNIIVEANDKNYTINYVDQPRIMTKTPFSIENQKFVSLEEALARINYKREQKEADIFKKIINENISNRVMSNVKEANIFENLTEAKISSNWSVKNVGYLNLKNGLNETFSKITQAGKEPNTLVKAEDGKYYLIKGNLKERSKVGIKKEIVEYKQNRSLGEIEVVGLYENTDDGLGKIMYEIKKTSIPLLVWK